MVALPTSEADSEEEENEKYAVEIVFRNG